MQQIVGRWWRIVAAMILIVGLGAHALPVHADTNPGWLQALNPAINQTDVPVQDNQAPAQDDNRNCQQQSFVVGPLGATSNDCMVQTAFGFAGSNGAMLPNDSSVAFRVKFGSPFISGPIPVPHQQVMLATTTSSNGNNVLYYRNILSGAQASMDPLTHQQIYTVTKGADGIIHDRAGNALREEDGITFSSDGSWMVYDVPHIAFVRVNMATLDVVPFAGSNAAVNGYKPPALSNAISNDGRYVAQASVGGSLTIYDLTTCDSVLNAIVQPAGCHWKTFMNNLSAAIPGYRYITNVHFINDETLGFTAIHNYTDANHYDVTNYTISPNDTSQSSLDYLGLGDSYASGEGAFNYEPGTDTDNNKCHTSTLSYPYLLGDQLFDSSKTIACSGSKMYDITDSTSAYQASGPRASGKEGSIYDQEIYSQFLPGYRPQGSFVDMYHPKNVTVSIGGNDVDFGDMVKACLGFGTCLPSAEDRREKAQEINAQFSKLVQTYTLLKQGVARGGKVYVVGYPYVARPGGDCGNNVHLNADEVQMTEDLVNFLDEDIQRAAAKAGVAYVDVRHAFDGHRLCEGTSPAVNGLTLGNDNFIIGNETYHPNAYGHYLLDQAILTQTNNFTHTMPAPQLNAAPITLDGTVPFLQAPQTGRSLNMLENQSGMTTPDVTPGVPLQLNVKGLTDGLLPNMSYQVVLHSTPTALGTITTDADANATAQVTIPAGTEPGLHTLHIYGKNLAGQSLDVYTSLCVGAVDSNNSMATAMSMPMSRAATQPSDAYIFQGLASQMAPTLVAAAKLAGQATQATPGPPKNISHPQDGSRPQVLAAGITLPQHREMWMGVVILIVIVMLMVLATARFRYRKR